MPVRFYLSPLIAIDHPVYPGRNYVGSVIEELALTLPPGSILARRNVCKVRPDGTLARNWCLVVVDAPDHAPFLADTRLRVLPDKLVDAAFTNGERNNVVTRLQERGVTVMTPPNTIRETVRLVCRHIYEDETATEAAAGI